MTPPEHGAAPWGWLRILPRYQVHLLKEREVYA